MNNAGDIAGESTKRLTKIIRVTKTLHGHKAKRTTRLILQEQRRLGVRESNNNEKCPARMKEGHSSVLQFAFGVQWKGGAQILTRNFAVF